MRSEKASPPKDRTFEEWLEDSVDAGCKYSNRHFLPEGTHYHCKFVYDSLMKERKK